MNQVNHTVTGDRFVIALTFDDDIDHSGSALVARQTCLVGFAIISVKADSSTAAMS